MSRRLRGSPSRRRHGQHSASSSVQRSFEDADDAGHPGHLRHERLSVDAGVDHAGESHVPSSTSTRTSSPSSRRSRTTTSSRSGRDLGVAADECADEIGARHDADQLSRLDDGEAVDASLDHQRGCETDRPVCLDRHRRRGHRLADEASLELRPVDLRRSRPAGRALSEAARRPLPREHVGLGDDAEHAILVVDDGRPEIPYLASRRAASLSEAPGVTVSTSGS